MSSSTTGLNQLQTWDDKKSSLTQRILALYEPPEFNTLRQLSDQAGADAAAQTGADLALRQAVSAVCDALVLNLRLVEKINEAKDLRAKLAQDPLSEPLRTAVQSGIATFKALANVGRHGLTQTEI